MKPLYEWVADNGKIMHYTDLIFPFMDSGFMYGYGVFETIRVHDGVACWVRDHLGRLEQSARVLGVPYSVAYEHCEVLIDALIEKNNVNAGILNVYVTPGDGTEKREGRCCMVIRKTDAGHAAKRVRLALRQHRYPRQGLDCHKTLSWLKPVLDGKGHSYDDVLLYTEDGIITETTRSNVFLYDGTTVVTPKIETVVPGIMRHKVMEVVHELGLTFSERDIHIDELKTMTEIGVSNMIRGVQCVASVEGLNGGFEGKIMRNLDKKIMKKIENEIIKKKKKIS